MNILPLLNPDNPRLAVGRTSHVQRSEYFERTYSSSVFSAGDIKPSSDKRIYGGDDAWPIPFQSPEQPENCPHIYSAKDWMGVNQPPRARGDNGWELPTKGCKFDPHRLA